MKNPTTINTKQKLEILNLYVSKNIKIWRTRYSSDIVGVYIGKKKRKGQELRYYSIVFQVKKKSSSNLIPKKIKVTFPDKVSKYIPTDVEEIGIFELRNIMVGDKINRINSSNFGTVGVFLQKNNRFYACSNMHVLAKEQLEYGHTYFYNPIKNQKNTDVIISRDGYYAYAFLEKCIFNGIDAGIARIKNSLNVKSLIRLFNAQILGYRIINWANYKQFPVYMSGFVSGKQVGLIENIGVDKFIEDKDIYLKNLIKTSLFSQGGDSGSPIFDNNYRIIGILVGGDSQSSYLIPIIDIMNYFKMSLFI